MMKKLLIVLALLLTTRIKLIDGFCSIYEKKSDGIQQEYYDEYYRDVVCCETVYKTLYKYVLCNQTNLNKGKPLDIRDLNGETNIKYIMFESSNMPLIPVGALSSLATSQLYLNNSGVKNIHPGAFSGLNSLEELYLQNNFIDKISTGTLNSLTHLQVLDLSNNNLEILEENAFLGLFQLRTINLSQNKLENVLPNTCDSLDNLQSITLSHNKLSTVPANLFSNLTKLESLKVSFNSLTQFNFLSAANLNTSENHVIKEIDLSNNNIEEITDLPLNLKHLNLSYNKILKIDDIFNKTKGLITLDISHNYIKNLSADDFTSLSNLTELFLQNNKINKLPIGCFRNLQTVNILNFSSNLIDELEYGTFGDLIALKILDISNNKLSYILESSFHALKNLEVLYIDNNFVSTFDPSDLLNHASKLKSVSLNNNPWNCKFLLNTINALKKAQVDIVKGDTQKTENVYGISCINYQFKNASSSLKPEDNKMALPNLTVLNRFMNDGFLNSSFYKYFENFKNFSAEEKIVSNYLNSKYFGDDFKNTMFYRYFDSEFKNAGFFKNFSKSFMDLSHSFYIFNQQFENSSFYKFFKSGKVSSQAFDDYRLQNDSAYSQLNKNHNEKKSFLIDRNSTPHFNYIFDNEALLKISQPQTEIIILLGFISILLLIITIIFITAFIKYSLVKTNYKYNSRTVNSKTDIVTDADLELL